MVEAKVLARRGFYEERSKCMFSHPSCSLLSLDVSFRGRGACVRNGVCLLSELLGSH